MFGTSKLISKKRIIILSNIKYITSIYFMRTQFAIHNKLTRRTPKLAVSHYFCLKTSVKSSVLWPFP